jgi:CubicO group peptidase (beta-lactamase class C family)
VTEFRSAVRVIEDAVRARAFPAAVIEVGDATQPLWQQAFGRLTFDADAPAATTETVFDLASLTKVLATTPLLMQQVERGAVALDEPVQRYFSQWRDAFQARALVRDLLSHSSGLPAYAPLYQAHHGRAAFEREICTIARAYRPRSTSVYSDLGFILLGFLLNHELALSRRFDALRAQMGVVEDLQYKPPSQWSGRIAPTEVDPWRQRLLVGEVHDENCVALNGVAGHAGLFGSAAAVGACARHVLQVLDGRTGAFSQETLRGFIERRTDVPGTTRALGWDTMLPTSSCGARLSPRAFGHTGFTGTSLWIDPDRGIYVVFLTNRVHPSRSNEAIRQVRPAVHDAVIEGLGGP